MGAEPCLYDIASTKNQSLEQDRLEEDRTQVAEPIASSPSPIASSPSQDEVARLAYSYWLSRGCTDGNDVNDWLRAEAEIRNTARSGNR